MTLRINSLTKEYVKVPARSFMAGLVTDVTPFDVLMAFPAQNVEPDVADWIAGDWETWPDQFYMARVLVGPGSGIALIAGVYDLWINVVTPQEDVKRQVDTVVVV